MSAKSRRGRRLRRALLGMAVVAGSTGVAACRPPLVCDPAPPPSLARPTPSRTPMVCDPPPPPRTATPQAASTPVAARRFGVRSVQMATDAGIEQAAVRGRVLDARGNPAFDVRVTARTTAGSGAEARTVEVVTRTGADGAYQLSIPMAGNWLLLVAGDNENAQSLQFEQHQVATVEWVETAQAQLPLAEIRSARIVWEGGLRFRAESPWAGAQWRWMASAGTLEGDEERVTWRPPANPGHYLLQVVADWGPAGVAVDALVATLGQDGRITLG